MIAPYENLHYLPIRYLTSRPLCVTHPRDLIQLADPTFSIYDVRKTAPSSHARIFI